MRRVFSMILALCLIVGLLPAVAVPHAHAEEELPETAKVSLVTQVTSLVLSVTRGGDPIYSKNVETTFTDTGSTTFTGYTQARSSVDDWNIKFEYPADGVPTLTLKGAKIDVYNNDTGKFARSSGTTAYSVGAILPVADCHHPLAVVIEEDSTIETNYGIIRCNSGDSTYFQDLTISSIGDAKLTARGGQVAICLRSGYDLTLDHANLDLYANQSATSGTPLNTTEGNITIKGGNLTLKQDNGVGMAAYTSGDITISDNAYVNVSASGAGNVGAINLASGAFTVTDSTVIAERKTSAGKAIQATSVTVNSGYVYAGAPYWGIDATTFVINGGTVIGETWTKSASNNWNKAFNKSPNVSGYACYDVVVHDGDSVTERETISTTDYYRDYVKIYHKVDEVTAKEPDCTNEGNSQYWTCPDCGKNYSDAEGKNEITDMTSVMIPATGEHAVASTEENIVEPATCDQNGSKTITEYCTCGEILSTTTVEIPAGHTEVAVEQVDPTTTAVGTTAGTKCSVCGIVLSGCEEIPMLKEAKIALMTRGGMTVTEGGAPVYKKTVSKQGYTSAGVENGLYWTYATGTADDWNIKFEYPMGGTPTLTLKDATLDHIGEDNTTLYTLQSDGTYASTGTLSAIICQSGHQHDLKIVLQGKNHIEVNNGIVRGSQGGDNHLNNITIVGEDGGSLTGTGKGIGISIHSGYNLTVENANIDIYTTSGGGVPVPFRTENGDITITGSNVTISNTKNCTIAAMTSGDIVITDSVLDLNAVFTNDTTAGAISACTSNNTSGGAITVTNSQITATGNGSIMRAYEDIEIDGGSINGDVAFGITSAQGNIKINGGEIEISGNAFGDKTPDLSGYEGWNAVAGTSKEAAKAVTDASALASAKYVKISAEPLCDHANITTTEQIVADATCAVAGAKTVTVTCADCGEVVSETTEVIPATGEHTFDDDDDTTCNSCDYQRITADSLTLDENNKLVFADSDETHIYHRATVYFLGEKTVSDITLSNPLKAIDTTAKTYWGIESINKIKLVNAGNYVIHLNYNTAGSPKITVAKAFTVTADPSVPTVEVNNGQLVVTDESTNNIYHRATVYYLGTETVSNIYDANALKAIDADAKTYWGLTEINKVMLLNSGNYVVQLHYNTEGSAKMTVAEAFTVVANRPKITRDAYNLSVTDNDETHTNHRAIAYYIGDEDVDMYDEAALKELDPDAKMRWGLTRINQIQMIQPGKYVIYLHYNLANGVKQTMVVKCTITLPVPEVWLEESGQIGTYVPAEVAHRNYEIYYLGDQTVEDIRDIDALKAIDPDPIKFDNQKQIAERGVLTESGNYVLVMYYNYLGSARQYIAEFATLA